MKKRTIVMEHLTTVQGGQIEVVGLVLSLGDQMVLLSPAAVEQLKQKLFKY